MEKHDPVREKKYRELKELFATGDMSAVVSGARRLIKEYNTAFAWNILGLALKQMGKVTQAKSLYEKLLETNENTLFLSNLGNLYYDLGRVSEAEKMYQRALAVEPNHYNATISLANIYSTLSRHDQAVALLKSLKAVTAATQSNMISDINYRIAENYRNKGEAYFDAAIKHYRESKNPLSSAHLLECIYKTKDQTEYVEEATLINRRGDLNPLLGAVQTHASIRYEIPDQNLFCSDPFNYISKKSLINTEGFDQSLVKSLIKVMDEFDLTLQPLLRGGSQSSGNIFSADAPCIQMIKRIIENKISEYRKENQKGAAFLDKWPKKYVLHGWFISLATGGVLSSHMHKQGWLSGSLYLRLEKPPNSEAGNIVFSLHGGSYPDDKKEYPKMELDLKEGDIVLFPSSIFHFTLPTTAESRRITLAFDLKPIYD